MRCYFLIIFSILATVGEATSIIFPTFTTPVVQGDGILILSVDRKRLMAFDRHGSLQWQQSLAQPSSLERRKGGALWLLTGPSVVTVDQATGKLGDEMTVTGVDWLHYDEPADVLYGTTKPKQFTDQTGLTVFDASTRKPLFHDPHAETLTYADPEILVVADGERKIADRGYTFTRGWLTCFRRADGTKLWTAEFRSDPDPYRYSARVCQWLVFSDGNEWLLIDVQTGATKRAAIDKPADSLGPSGLREKDGHLVYTVSAINSRNFSRSAHSITVVTVPELQILSRTTVEVIEAGPTEDAGDYLITDSLYRTACFHRDGTKVWEHFQMHRTSAIDGFIFFSDFNHDNARLGMIEISTGKETILHTEPANPWRS